jgi:hypothetical protein
MGQKWYQWIAYDFPLFHWTFFFNFKGSWPLKLKLMIFVSLKHFIVDWSVKLAAVTNFHGSVTPQDATTTVIAIVYM